MSDIYTDNGAAFMRRTRVFRNTGTGSTEWMYAVDYANGDKRWYAYGMQPRTVEQLNADGMGLTKLDNGTNFATELTPEGEQAVIPGCERNASPKAKQLSLFG